jgi:hypothetical protein
MERCKTCTWWTPSTNVRGDGFCEATRVDERMYRVVEGVPRLAEAYAPVEGVMDDRGFYDPRGTPAVLLTSEDFGCVQHEPREDAS